MTNAAACNYLEYSRGVGVEQYFRQRADVCCAKMEKCFKTCSAYLNELQKQGGYTQYGAEDALKAEYPWLPRHGGYAKYAIAS